MTPHRKPFLNGHWFFEIKATDAILLSKLLGRKVVREEKTLGDEKED
jgi:hypothetical protein